MALVTGSSIKEQKTYMNWNSRKTDTRYLQKFTNLYEKWALNGMKHKKTDLLAGLHHPPRQLTELTAPL